jgi:hypothetical protein
VLFRSEARRPAGGPPTENFDLLQRLAQRRRNVQAILDRADQDPQTALRLLAQTDELTRGLAPADAAAVLCQMADRYHRTGRQDMAAEVFQLLGDRYPDGPPARLALLWLVQYYSSGDAGRVPGSGTGVPTGVLAMREGTGDGRGTNTASALDRAIAVGQYVERTRPDLIADPAFRYPLAAAYRQRGMAREAQRLYMIQSRGPGRDAWWNCGQGEAWLLQPKGPPPKPVLECIAVPERPKLDGRLDDPLWQRAKAVALQSALHDDAEWPAAVMLAHDAQFLYIGISCRQAPGAKYDPAPGGPRPRDADLSAHDRVDILLDVGRSHATYYQLTIDSRGWVADARWGDSTWNPKWFVATQTADGTWTAEAAISLTQLQAAVVPAASTGAGRTAETPAAPAAGVAARTVWAIGIQRTVPGVGFQSWSTPASTEIMPEGFGYLMFE